MRQLYAVVAYAAFVLSSAWSAVFLAGTIDRPARSGTAAALAVDGALLLAFAAHHTVAARDAFKRLVPPAVERSTFVLVASLLLFAVLGFWQPVPATLWRVPAPWSAAIWALYAAGWALALGSTFLIGHAEFFGLQRAGGAPIAGRGLYAWCRHPMMLGLLIAFWATPHLSVGHLFFAACSTGYVLVGIRFEERGLRARFGADYDEYARRVPALIPWPRRQESAGSISAGRTSGSA